MTETAILPPGPANPVLREYNMEGWASNLVGRVIRISFFRFVGEPLGDYYLGRGPFIS
jgi:hypothetical protein